MGLPQNVKRRRIELGLSQQDLANALGYRTRSSIAKIESGEAAIPSKKLSFLADALDTTIDHLCSDVGFGGIGNAFSSNIQVESPSSMKKNQAKVSAIILAGGMSTRNMQNVPNQFITIMGKPVIMYCLETYERHPAVDEIVIVCVNQWIDILRAYIERAGITKVASIIPAGDSGLRSIENGLVHARFRSKLNDIVILQEATRPLVTEEDISRVINGCEESDSAILCSSMHDHVMFEKSNGKVAFLDRSTTYCLENPEAYRISLLDDIMEQASQEPDYMKGSSCGLLAHQLGLELNLIECGHNNMKMIRQEDTLIITALLKSR